MSSISEAIASGPRVYLRPLKLIDAHGPYLTWMNDPEVMQHLESRFKRYSVADLEKYLQEVTQQPSIHFLAICLKDGERHIGNLKLGPVNPLHRCGEIGIIIGAKDCWGQGYATEAISLLAAYAFGPLQLHKLTAGCYATNEGSARAFCKAGFSIEGRRISQCWQEDRFVDTILLGMVNPEEMQLA